MIASACPAGEWWKAIGYTRSKLVGPKQPKPGPCPTEFHLQPSNKIGITRPRPTQRASKLSHYRPNCPRADSWSHRADPDGQLRIPDVDGRNVAGNEPAYAKAGVGEPSFRCNLSQRRARAPQARAGRRLPRGCSDRGAVIGRRGHQTSHDQPVTGRLSTPGRRSRICLKMCQKANAPTTA